MTPGWGRGRRVFGVVAPWGRRVGAGLTSLCALETPPYLADSSLCQGKVPSPVPTVCCVSNQKLLPPAGHPLCLPSVPLQLYSCLQSCGGRYCSPGASACRESQARAFVGTVTSMSLWGKEGPWPAPCSPGAPRNP